MYPPSHRHLASQPHPAWTRAAPSPSSALVYSPCPQAAKDAAFLSLLDGFRCTGGMARADDLTTQRQFSIARPIGEVARWIVDHTVVYIQWNGVYWLPLFQFGHAGTPHPLVAAAVAELSGVLDEWKLAEWFSAPNNSLDHGTPAATFQLDGDAVLRAAQIDRLSFGAELATRG